MKEKTGCGMAVVAKIICRICTPLLEIPLIDVWFSLLIHRGLRMSWFESPFLGVRSERTKKSEQRQARLRFLKMTGI